VLLRRTPIVTLTLALVVASAAGCVDRGPGPVRKKVDPKTVAANILVTPPADLERVDVVLGGKVKYLGNRVVDKDNRPISGPLAPGGTVRLIHYWQVLAPVGPGWEVFRYARGAPGSADFMNFTPTDMDYGLPVSQWKAGQIIADPQDITLRPDWRSPQATIYVGLIADGGHQLGDRMFTVPSAPPAVIDRAIVARSFQIDLSKAPPPAGTVYIPHASGPITIDGIGTEPGWATAVMSPELVTAEGSQDPVGKTIARMSWDEQNLYVLVQITDSDIYSQYKTHDEPLWKQDVVELFIDADGNRRGYVELQVNPNNATFDSWFANTRAQPGDETWTSNMQTAVRVRGTADKAGDADQGWDVEIAIPLAAVKGRDEAMHVAVPPQVGDKWRLNVVRVDYRSSGGSPGVASWNRIPYSDFHALDRMLTVVFADTSGSIKPTPSTPSAPVTPSNPASGSAIGSGAAVGSGAATGSGATAGSGAATAHGAAAGSGSGSGSASVPSHGGARPGAGSAAGSGAPTIAPLTRVGSGSARGTVHPSISAPPRAPAPTSDSGTAHR
jgi:hypothetical protein